MLICQLAIGGQKGGGFCHHRIEVISFGILQLRFFLFGSLGRVEKHFKVRIPFRVYLL
jgi:hypothetical protein